MELRERNLKFRAHTFAARHSQDGAWKRTKDRSKEERCTRRDGIIHRRAETLGRLVDIRPRVLIRPMDQWDSRQRGRWPISWPIEAKVQTRQRRHAPQRWNYSNGIHETGQLFRVGSKLGEWVVRTILFVRRTPLFSFLASSRSHHLSSSIISYIPWISDWRGIEIFLFLLFILSSLDRFLSFEVIFENRDTFYREFKLATLESIQTRIYSIGFRLRDGKHFFFHFDEIFSPFEKRRKAKDRFASKYNRPFDAACLFQFFWVNREGFSFLLSFFLRIWTFERDE